MHLEGSSGRHRLHACCRMLRPLFFCLVCFGWLPEFGVADTYDIGVTLFTDPNCLFRDDTFVLLDGGCYANKWAPNSTKGFKMNIVFFNEPQRIDMREYLDDCHTLAMPKRTLVTGSDRCNPFLGSTFAQFDIRFRSSTCKGSMCSTLAIAVQTFYRQAACTGPAFSMFRYPVQGECLRTGNGTQDLTASGDDRNISLMDYGGSDDCTPVVGGRFRTYQILNQNCYPLYTTQEPMSFSWRVERIVPYAAASGAYRSLPAALTIVAILRSTRELASLRWH